MLPHYSPPFGYLELFRPSLCFLRSVFRQIGQQSMNISVRYLQLQYRKFIIIEVQVKNNIGHNIQTKIRSSLAINLTFD